ncbi:hypothetical protein [Conexibacter woesei]|uniref:Uncharacterized protein n=1 Tax=Conexibacter woesei (strain DSM 14684 / CCUG 47730 / CIP 108061 / JCM 11494 / NBRC 100937 / ID131577) TaxID=469383 RepID=D3FB21_CONWI|nr:hypothetical protein [Conexibacter woesei]ADB53213.1 hypothetical protein Cwoe_4800 [Conexibacter woesei DSM 14684]
MPKLTNYPATLDVSGQIHVKAEADDTGECTPGQDVTVDFDADAELGRPRRVSLTIFDGAVATSFARKARGAVHKGALTGYRETNYCRPSEPVELEQPACTSHRGTLRAWLAKGPDLRRTDDDLAPLSHPVALALMRDGGGTQDPSCMRYLSSGLTLWNGLSNVLDTLEIDKQTLTIPIGVGNVRFQSLRRGESIRRVIRLNGACDHVFAGSQVALGSRDRRDCTVTGSFFVALKRVG